MTVNPLSIKVTCKFERPYAASFLIICESRNSLSSVVDSPSYSSFRCTSTTPLSSKVSHLSRAYCRFTLSFLASLPCDNLALFHPNCSFVRRQIHLLCSNSSAMHFRLNPVSFFEPAEDSPSTFQFRCVSTILRSVHREAGRLWLHYDTQSDSWVCS